MTQTLEQQIAATKASIQSLEEALPYADGGAYRQDKQRISKLRGELAQLHQKKEAQSADTQQAGG